MKKIFLIAAILIGITVIGCSKQNALETIIQDPDARIDLINKLLSYENVRAELADSIFADSEILMARLDGFAADENMRGMLLGHLLAADTTGEWIIAKLVENPDMKKKMRSAARK